jgi:hypothetical protein
LTFCIFKINIYKIIQENTKGNLKMSTKEQRIIEAASRLQADGKKPTMEAIRQEIGGGSFATISPALRKWRESQQQEQLKAVALEMPKDVNAIFEKFTNSLWREFESLITEKTANKQPEDEKQKINAIQSERDEALTEIERLESVLNESTIKNAALTETNQELTLQAQKQQMTLDFVESKQIELKNELQQLKDALRLKDGEVGELRGELKVVREMNKI